MKQPLPFLSTHIANIALNKAIGLVFLHMEPQKTSGLTSVSVESLVCDQLAVAKWMIASFLYRAPEDAKMDATPWVTIPEYVIRPNEMPDTNEMAQYDGQFVAIGDEVTQLGEGLWDQQNEKAQTFLHRLMAQIEQCELFLRTRVEIIKVVADLPLEVYESIESQMEFEATLAKLGPIYATQLLQACGMLGIAGVAALGYLGVKNAVPATRIFARKLLDVAQLVVTSEAQKRGYAVP